MLERKEMKRHLVLGIVLALGMVWATVATETLSIFVKTEAGFVEISLDGFSMIEGTVA